jgi:hypothetical protein
VKTWVDVLAETPLTRGKIEPLKSVTANLSDKELHDRLAAAVQAQHAADELYREAKADYCARRLERLASGVDPEEFGQLLSGHDATSQQRREAVVRSNAEIDGLFR